MKFCWICFQNSDEAQLLNNNTSTKYFENILQLPNIPGLNNMLTCILCEKLIKNSLDLYETTKYSYEILMQSKFRINDPSSLYKVIQHRRPLVQLSKHKNENVVIQQPYKDNIYEDFQEINKNYEDFPINDSSDQVNSELIGTKSLEVKSQIKINDKESICLHRDIKHIEIFKYGKKQANNYDILSKTDDNMIKAIAFKIDKSQEKALKLFENDKNNIDNDLHCSRNETVKMINNDMKYLDNDIKHIDISESGQKQLNNHRISSETNDNMIFAFKTDDCSTYQSKNNVFQQNEIVKKVKNSETRFKEMRFKIIYLNKEEQLEEIVNKKKCESYLKKKFCCSQCGIGFLTCDIFKNHMEKHTEAAGRHICHICGLRFKSREVLSQHVLAHERYFVCELCSYKVRRPWHCILHRSKCGSTRVNYNCPVCSKSFSDVHSLKVHEKYSHLKAKAFVCDTCQKRFSQKQKLTIHIRTHTGEKPHSCDICHRNFASNSNLKAHCDNVHNDVDTKNNYCVECDTYYKTAKSLKRHFVVSSKHAGRYPAKYQCVDCKKLFQTEKGLKAHSQFQHLTKISFKCIHCNKIFSNNANLKRHERNAH